GFKAAAHSQYFATGSECRHSLGAEFEALVAEKLLLGSSHVEIGHIVDSHRDEARAEKFDDLCVVEHCLTGKHAVASGPTEAIAGIHDQEYWLALLCSELARFGERNLPPNRCPWLVLEVELLGEQSKLGIGQLARWLVVGTDTDHARAYCSHDQ